MWTRMPYILFSLVGGHPLRAAAAIGLFCLLGILAGAGVSARARRETVVRPLIVDAGPLALALLPFGLCDWALLRALPVLRLSFSSEIALPLAASLVVRFAILWCLLWAALIARAVARQSGSKMPVRWLAIALVALNLAFSAVQVDAYVVEPLWVETTHIRLSFADLDAAAAPVRVVHLTDTHIERLSYREAAIVEQVNALQPDIVVLTGDYLNLSRLSDPVSSVHFRQFTGQLHAPYGIYAVRGSVEPTLASMEWLVEGTEVVWLEQEAVTVDVRGQQVTLVGVACSHRDPLDAARLDEAVRGVPEDGFTLLLYHSPDLIDEAADRRVDLYLGGHTHGGQLRLPFYGAIFTSSKYGKRYESGLFEEGSTRMVISRGLGFEGQGMPRARFLCRPEIVSLELGG